jgi:NADH-quinone oxidoreductase subunit E/NADP-reducing hydrogenase subunit HndA
MSDAVTTDEVRETVGFFGAEQAQITEDIPPEIWSRIDEFLEANPGGQERLIPLLHMAQEIVGYLPFAVQEYVADKLGLSPVQVYGIISFYHFFTTTPRARHQIKVCMGTACFVRNSQRLLDALKDACQTDLGGISEDHLFNLDQVRCIGACGLAPAIMSDDEVRGNLTPTKVRSLVRKLRKEAQKVKRELEESKATEEGP